MATAPPPAAVPPRASPLDALSDAVEHARRQLFPLNAGRWLVLGFLAFLDQCGRTGGYGGRVASRDDFGRVDAEQVGAWVSSHVGLLVVLTAVILALSVALVALVLWINTRAVFMYLDAVVTGRAEVRRPWREHADAAGSLFAWRFGLALATLFVLLLGAGLAAAVVLAAPRGAAPSGPLLVALIGLALLILPLLVLAALVSVALRDFVAPLQLHLRCPCPDAARVAWALMRAQPGAFVLYLLLKIAFTLAAAVVLLAACCFTCCVAVLPVISQTLFQPLWFFERAFSVCLLRRLGYDLFTSLHPR